jgi:hypothetical protein
LSITFQREELFAEVWTTPLTTLAKKYGLSDNGVRKVCKAMDIPLPKAGHWAKAAAGKAPPPPLLPASAARTTFHSTPVKKSETPTQSVDEDKAWLDARLIEEKKARNKIVVAAKPAKWHPAVLPLKFWLEECVTKYRNALAEKARREKSPMRPPEPAFHEWEIASNDPVLGRTHRSVAMRVSVNTYNRALAILNSLAYAAEERGFTVELMKGNSRLRFSLEYANLDMYVTERMEATFVSVLNPWDKKPHMEKKLVSTGSLRLNIERSYAAYQINDMAGAPLEDSLNQVFAYGYGCVIKARERERARVIEREKQEVRRLQLEEMELQRKAEAQRRAEETRKREELLQHAVGLDKAESIRRLVTNLEKRFAGGGELTEEFANWRTWALEVAAAQDPTDRLFEFFQVRQDDQVG